MNSKKNPQPSDVTDLLILPARQIGALGLVCMAGIFGIGGIAGAQSPGNLLINGSFENRTSPPAPVSGFSNGVPDNWTSSSPSNTYLVHESHGTVPGNAAIDGSIIVGAGPNVVLSQNITVTGKAPLAVQWWANNETAGTSSNPLLYQTAAQFNDLSGNFITWSGLLDNNDPAQLSWFEQNYTTDVDFEPGTYEFEIFIGGLSSIDNVIIFQLAQSIEEMFDSFVPLVSDVEIVIDGQQAGLGLLFDETLLAEKETSRLRAGGWLADTGATRSEGIEARDRVIGTLTYGYGIDGKTTVGATASISASNLGGDRYNYDSGFGLSIWTEYSETGLAREGWQAGASLGWGHESLDITRGRGFANMFEVDGDADLTTWGARATVGYGFQQETWLLTPSASIVYFDTKRDSYAESGTEFLAQYDSLSADRSMARLELAAERAISARGTLELTLGMEHDLYADSITLRGQSDVPGRENFAIASDLTRRDTRGFLNTIYSHQLDEDRILSGVFRIGQAAYGSKPQLIAGLRFENRF